MSVQIKATTDDFPPAKLWAHGTIEVVNDGNILIYQATGPFNREVIQALGTLRASILGKLAAIGIWGEIICINGSAMATMGTIAALTKHFEEVARLDIKSSFTAFVIGPDVEGGKFMARLFVNSYAAFDRAPPVFECLDDARRWIEGKLAGA